MTITLPLPGRTLSPNGRVAHWSTLHKAKKAAKIRARLATLQALGGSAAPALQGYRLTFTWPVKRNRDDDNAVASCKAYLDGIATALRVDDSTLRLLGVEFRQGKPGRLEVELIPIP